jgi:hypothetical protein
MTFCVHIYYDVLCSHILMYNLINIATVWDFFLFSVLAATAAGTAATLGKCSVPLKVRPDYSCSWCSQWQLLAVYRCSQWQLLAVTVARSDSCSQWQLLAVYRCSQWQLLAVYRCSQWQLLAVYRLHVQWSEISKLHYALSSLSLKYRLCSGPRKPMACLGSGSWNRPHLRSSTMWSTGPSTSSLGCAFSNSRSGRFAVTQTRLLLVVWLTWL